MRIQVDSAQVGNGERPTLLRCAADEGGVDVDAYPTQPLHHLRGGPVDAPYDEPTLRIVIFHDRAAAGARQLDVMHGDRRQHVIDVEAGARCLADVAQSFELADRAVEPGQDLVSVAKTNRGVTLVLNARTRVRNRRSALGLARHLCRLIWQGNRRRRS